MAGWFSNPAKSRTVFACRFDPDGIVAWAALSPAHVWGQIRPFEGEAVQRPNLLRRTYILLLGSHRS